MSSATINELLKNNSIWQAAQKGRPRPALPTGYDALDKALHYGGWPRGCLNELLLLKNGIGEIRLLSPLLARLSRQPGYICWVNPPFRPYAPALVQQGLDLTRLFFIQAKSNSDTIWASQQAMNSGACSAVMVWLDNRTSPNEIRKLSLAAKSGNCWGFTFRDARLQQQASPAALRLCLQSHQGRQHLSIIKQPGGWSGQQITLNLFPERAYWTAKAASDWPTYQPEVQQPDKTVKDSVKVPGTALSLPTKVDRLFRKANAQKTTTSTASTAAFH